MDHKATKKSIRFGKNLKIKKDGRLYVGETAIVI
jgi:hypothetical protein